MGNRGLGMCRGPFVQSHNWMWKMPISRVLLLLELCNLKPAYQKLCGGSPWVTPVRSNNQEFKFKGADLRFFLLVLQVCDGKSTYIVLAVRLLNKCPIENHRSSL